MGRDSRLLGWKANWMPIPRLTFRQPRWCLRRVGLRMGKKKHPLPPARYFEPWVATGALGCRQCRYGCRRAFKLSSRGCNSTKNKTGVKSHLGPAGGICLRVLLLACSPAFRYTGLLGCDFPLLDPCPGGETCDHLVFPDLHWFPEVR